MNTKMNNHHTKLKGDIALQSVIFDLIKRGYYVFTPLSENCPYDLIVDCGSLLKVQVKYRVNFTLPNKTSWSDSNGSHQRKILDTDFDYFALVSEDYKKIAYCPVSMKGCTIRFEIPEASFSNFYYYKDYDQFGSKPIKRSIKEFKSDAEIAKIIKDNNLFGYKTVKHKTKIVWPSDEILKKLVYEKPTSQLAKDLGVSDSAIAKYCKKRNISKPPRGYWEKIYKSA